MEKLIQNSEKKNISDHNSHKHAASTIMLDFDEHQVPPDLELCEYYEVRKKKKIELSRKSHPLAV